MDELAQCYNVLTQLDINNTIDHRPDGDEKWSLENEKTVTPSCRKRAAARPLKAIRDLRAQIWQRAGDADEAHLALLLHALEFLQCAVLLEFPWSEAAVELDEVQVIGAHATQALLDAGADVLCRMDVLAAHPGPRDTAALGGQEVLGAAMGDGRPDPFLTAAVVRRGVDEVDAGVQGGIQYARGLLLRDLRAGGGAAQLHRPVAETGHLEAHPAKHASRQRRHLWLS